MGNTICRVVTKFEITVLGVPKIAQNNTQKCRITCHTLPVADQKLILNTITYSHNFKFTNIVLPSLRVLRYLPKSRIATQLMIRQGNQIRKVAGKLDVQWFLTDFSWVFFYTQTLHQLVKFDTFTFTASRKIRQFTLLAYHSHDVSMCLSHDHTKSEKLQKKSTHHACMFTSQLHLF